MESDIFCSDKAVHVNIPDGTFWSNTIFGAWSWFKAVAGVRGDPGHSDGKWVYDVLKSVLNSTLTIKE